MELVTMSNKAIVKGMEDDIKRDLSQSMIVRPDINNEIVRPDCQRKDNYNNKIKKVCKSIYVLCALAFGIGIVISKTFSVEFDNWLQLKQKEVLKFLITESILYVILASVIITIMKSIGIKDILGLKLIIIVLFCYRIIPQKIGAIILSIFVIGSLSTISKLMQYRLIGQEQQFVMNTPTKYALKCIKLILIFIFGANKDKLTWFNPKFALLISKITRKDEKMSIVNNFAVFSSSNSKIVYYLLFIPAMLWMVAVRCIEPIGNLFLFIHNWSLSLSNIIISLLASFIAVTDLIEVCYLVNGIESGNIIDAKIKSVISKTYVWAFGYFFVLPLTLYYIHKFYVTLSIIDNIPNISSTVSEQDKDRKDSTDSKDSKDSTARNNLITSTSKTYNDYKNYWLNIYFPSNTRCNDDKHILHGFQCCRNIIKHQKCCHLKMDNCINVMLVIFFVILAYLSMIIGTNINMNGRGIDNSNMSTNHSLTQYPICSSIYGEYYDDNYSNYQTVLDMVFLSKIVYELDKFNVSQVIDQYFEHQFEIKHVEYKEYPKFAHIKHKRLPIHYVAIRGTEDLLETLQNMSLFFPSFLWKLLTYFIPFLHCMPNEFIQDIIYQTSSLSFTDNKLNFIDTVYDYMYPIINELAKDNNNTHKIYLIGHSLGGVISTTIANRIYELGDDYNNIDIESFSINRPGTILSSKKLDFNSDTLQFTATSIINKRDLLSNFFDQHGGFIQYVNCDEHLSSLKCHKQKYLICDLFKQCQSVWNNHFNHTKKVNIFKCFCNENIGDGKFSLCFHNISTVISNDIDIGFM